VTSALPDRSKPRDGWDRTACPSWQEAGAKVLPPGPRDASNRATDPLPPGHLDRPLVPGQQPGAEPGQGETGRRWRESHPRDPPPPGPRGTRPRVPPKPIPPKGPHVHRIRHGMLRWHLRAHVGRERTRTWRRIRNTSLLRTRLEGTKVDGVDLEWFSHDTSRAVAICQRRRVHV